MLHRLRVVVVVLSTPLAVLVLVGGLLGAVRSSAQTATGDLRVFDEVVRLIFGAYVEPASIDVVMDGAMRGLADGLDSATSYLTPDEVRLVEAGTPLPPGELGLTVARQYYLRIVGVEDDSPAARAGLRTGDYIRAIDEVPTRDMSTFTGTRLLHGAVGSATDLLIIRGNTADPHEVSLVREPGRSERARGRQLPSGEAYVRVSSFEAGAAQALREAVASLGSAAEAGLLVDLRGVADGTADEGIAAARLFVADGVIATRSRRSVTTAVTEAAAGDGTLTMPVVLVVSNGTAHAAEIFAAALADNDRALLVGEPTAGLAGVQRLVELPEGHGLWMTTEQYTRADGTPIHSHGLRPDVPVASPVVDFGDTAQEDDPILDRARDILADPEGAARTTADEPDVSSTAIDPGTRRVLDPVPELPLPAETPQSPE